MVHPSSNPNEKNPKTRRQHNHKHKRKRNQRKQKHLCPKNYTKPNNYTKLERYLHLEQNQPIPHRKQKKTKRRIRILLLVHKNTKLPILPKQRVTTIPKQKPKKRTKPKKPRKTSYHKRLKHEHEQKIQQRPSATIQRNNHAYRQHKPRTPRNIPNRTTHILHKTNDKNRRLSVRPVYGQRNHTLSSKTTREKIFRDRNSIRICRNNYRKIKIK